MAESRAGSWKVWRRGNDLCVVTDDYKTVICHVAGTDDDAIRIAAAPDMHRALVAICDALKGQRLSYETFESLAMMWEALAKAKGQE